MCACVCVCVCVLMQQVDSRSSAQEQGNFDIVHCTVESVASGNWEYFDYVLVHLPTLGLQHLGWLVSQSVRFPRMEVSNNLICLAWPTFTAVLDDQ